MPASLLSLHIRGIRSYSPSENKVQSIEFTPLTLIVGSNGNGKTTIIEALKFIISGEEPPLSDGRRNFIHTPTGSLKGNERITQASIRLNFQSSKNENCVAKRDIFYASNTRTPSISSCYKIGSNSWVNVHRIEDWNKTMPALFNLPNQAILNNVVLCHQEENLWCMGQSAVVKQVFDEIFGCEQYKKEIKNIDAEIKTCKSDLLLSQKDLQHDKEKVERKKSLNNQIEAFDVEINNISSETYVLDSEIEALVKVKDTLMQEMTKLEKQKSEISSYRFRIEECSRRELQLRNSLKKPMIEPSLLSDDELTNKMEDHYKNYENSKKLQVQLKNEESAIESELSKLEIRKRQIQSDINRLKVMELKIEDTNKTLTNLLQEVKADQDVDGIDLADIAASLKALEQHEKLLQQNKSDQSELEDELSVKQQQIAKSISKLEGDCQGYLQKIKNKEKYLVTLQEQLVQADPLSKDLTVVTQNLEKMSLIARQIPPSELVSSLSELIKISRGIIDNLLEKYAKDVVVKIKDDIIEETKGIEESKRILEHHQEHIAFQTKQQLETEAEHVKARSMSKGAHNKAHQFKIHHSQAKNYYKRYLSEKILIESSNLRDKENQLQEVEAAIEQKRNESSSLSSRRAKLSDDMSESFELYDEYQRNVSLRETLNRAKLYRDKMSTLNDDPELDQNLKKLAVKYDEQDKRLVKLRDQRSRLNGSKTQIAHQIERLREELKTLSRVNVKYAESLGKVVCNKIVLEDLEKLKECFQKSILNFHDHMIVKINEVLRIRWRQIYQGGDIDRIELVDEEITRGKTKAFNYYIGMWKGGVRMKMRDKSSAGQKALASIILRMTLAELFVKDFAFMALDEPTANLDNANVLSLAKAIGSYVRRRNQRGINIQWIIITHSEQFLKALSNESSSHYYRVQLGDEGYSKIARVSAEASVVEEQQ